MTPQGFALMGLMTLAMLLTYFWTGVRVGPARKKYNVVYPATEGSADFNRVYRAHVNTLEQLAIAVPAFWIFAEATHAKYAAVAALVWVIGRIIYVLAYSKQAESRSTGFMIGFIPVVVAIVWSAGALGYYLLQHHSF